MKLEQQVCSLDLAKRLKELGVKQESYFYWSGTEQFGFLVRPFEDRFQYPEAINLSAFTVAELGEMLPDAVATYRYKTEDEDPNTWACIKYVPGNHSTYEYVCHADTEANARGKCLIYLLEQGMIKA